jgi:hypothetical protein
MPTNQLHPVYHGHSFHAGSRVDVNRVLPPDLDEADLDEWIEQLSEPPRYSERICPVSTVIGTEIIRGKNWSEMMVKSYRVFLRMFYNISYFLGQALAEKFEERGMIPFMSWDVDPDTLHQIIELDYEQGEGTYSDLIKLFSNGIIAPVATVPFHVILPLLQSDFDRRIVIRMGLMFYWKLIKSYHEFVKTQHDDNQFILIFWLPECGYSKNVIEILHQEFLAMAKADKIRDPHLVVLLDNLQAGDCDNDVLMKSWDVLKDDENQRISIVFRDRSFSEWVTFSNPSVKKLIDRTIAKVDSELNTINVDYCWSHFEEVETLTFSSKSAMNFEQKVVKLSQLSYLAMSPDFFLRRKIKGAYASAPHEPLTVKLRENTSWSDWHTHISLGRWEGVLDSNARFKLVDENRPYVRRTKGGKVQEIGPQCWKIALVKARDNCTRAIKGNPETMKGGFLEILADVCGHKDAKIVKRNVENFLVHFCQIQWREHFLLHHDLSEADIALQEIVDKYLMKDVKKRVSDEDYVKAGVAAQGYFWALDSHRSYVTHFENMDQRAVYQGVTMLVLAMCNCIHLLRWSGKSAEEKQVFELLKTELLDFKDGYNRYRLADYGVTEQEWRDSIKSVIDDSDANVIERAARRLAARHLRGLGYRREFTKEDENISTNVGHIWNSEVENSNYKWENKLYCGLREE